MGVATGRTKGKGRHLACWQQCSPAPCCISKAPKLHLWSWGPEIRGRPPRHLCVTQTQHQTAEGEAGQAWESFLWRKWWVHMASPLTSHLRDISSGGPGAGPRGHRRGWLEPPADSAGAGLTETQIPLRRTAPPAEEPLPHLCTAGDCGKHSETPTFPPNLRHNLLSIHVLTLPPPPRSPKPRDTVALPRVFEHGPKTGDRLSSRSTCKAIISLEILTSDHGCPKPAEPGFEGLRV